MIFRSGFLSVIVYGMTLIPVLLFSQPAGTNGSAGVCAALDSLQAAVDNQNSEGEVFWSSAVGKAWKTDEKKHDFAFSLYHFFIANSKKSNQVKSRLAGFVEREYADCNCFVPDSLHIRPLINIALGLSMRSEYDSSETVALKALSLIRKVYGENSESEAQVLMNMGTNYMRSGDQKKALDYNLKALHLRQTQPNPKCAETGRCMRNVGQSYYFLDDMDRSLIYYQKAESVYSACGNVPDERLALLYDGLASLKIETAHPDDAIHYYNKSLNLFMKKNDPESISNTYRGISTAYLNNLQYSEAEKYAKLAISSGEGFTSGRELSKSWYHLAKVFFARNETDQCLEANRNAIRLLMKNLDPDSLLRTAVVTESMNNPLLLDYLDLNGISWQKKFFISGQAGDLLLAWKNQALIYNILSNLRNNFSGESQLRATSLTYKSYQSGLKTAHHLFTATGDSAWLDSAFIVMEKSKAVTLLRSMQELQAKKVAGIPDSVRDREKELRATLASLTEQEIEEKSGAARQRVLDSLFSLKFQVNSDIEKFIRRMEQEYPSYYDMKFRLQPATRAELQAALRPGELLLQYLWGDSAVYVYELTKSRVALRLIQLSDSLAAATSGIHQLLSDQSFRGMNPHIHQKFVRQSHKCYLELAAPSLAAHPGCTSLIVIPDGPLWYLPFESLVTDAGKQEKASYKTATYLIQKYPVSYSHSGSFFEAGRKKKSYSARPMRFAAFAPEFTGEEQPSSPMVSNEQLKNREEVMAIYALAGGKVFTDRHSTRENFLAEAPQADIVHIASHASTNEEEPVASFIQFQSEEGGSDLLYAYEMYNMEMRAEMAVLSACNTGSGQVVRGEGVMSLARGFTYAGCKSLVMSLWQVSDNSTKEIMTDFYNHLAKGLSKNEALHAAKLNYLDQAKTESAHPWYWAGFVLIGDTDSISLTGPDDFPWYVWSGAAILGVVCVWILKKRFRKSY